MAGLNQVPI